MKSKIDIDLLTVQRAVVSEVLQKWTEDGRGTFMFVSTTQAARYAGVTEERYLAAPRTSRTACYNHIRSHVNARAKNEAAILTAIEEAKSAGRRGVPVKVESPKAAKKGAAK